jgi:hypothetical protein
MPAFHQFALHQRERFFSVPSDLILSRDVENKKTETEITFVQRGGKRRDRYFPRPPPRFTNFGDYG